jgi:hypothetical protein
MSQKTGKGQFPPSAAYDWSFLTRPPLLRSESEREFNQLLSALRVEIQPDGVIEEMYVAEIAIIIFDILRLRRCKVTILNAAFPQALRSLIYESSCQEVPQEEDSEFTFNWDLERSGKIAFERTRAERERAGKVDDLAKRWFSSKSAKQKVSSILRSSQKDESAIEARAIQHSSTQLDWLEKMLTALEARRDRSLRRIAEYRQSFAHRLRASTDRIIDAEPSQLPHLEDGTKKSAA